jgi:hypothetical protein
VIFNRSKPNGVSSVSEDPLDFSFATDVVEPKVRRKHDLFVLRGTDAVAKCREASTGVQDALDLSNVSGADWMVAAAEDDGKEILVPVDETNLRG